MARLFLPVVVLVVILSFASLAISNQRAGQQRLDMWEDVYWHIMKPCVKTGWFLLPNTYRAKNTLQKHHSNLELAPEFNEAINIYLSVFKSMSLPKDKHGNVLIAVGLSKNETMDVYKDLKEDCIYGLREHFSDQRDKGKPLQGTSTMLDYTKTSAFVDDIVGTIIEVSGKKYSVLGGLMNRPGTPPYW